MAASTGGCQRAPICVPLPVGAGPRFFFTFFGTTSIRRRQGGPNGRDPQNPREPDQGGKGETGEIRIDRLQERWGHPKAITPDGRLTGRLSGTTAQAGEASA